jgi:glutamate-ammonia-ligase adenylyltransferase
MENVLSEYSGIHHEVIKSQSNEARKKNQFVDARHLVEFPLQFFYTSQHRLISSEGVLRDLWLNSSHQKESMTAARQQSKHTSPLPSPRGFPTRVHFAKIEEMYLASGLGAHAKQFLPSLARRLRNSADEEMTVTNLLRFIEASFNPTTLFHDITEHSILLDMLIAAFSTSQFFSDILVRDPELFHWLTTTTVLEQPKRKEEFLAAARQTTSLFHSPEKKINALKRFQRREFLRIGMRDILGHADLETTTRELSHLADAVFQRVAELMWNELSEKYGGAPETSWAIFGLGKLGGEELNYSSDIDIIAVFDEDGALSTSKRITHGEFFIRFIERIVQTLTAVTEEGFFYRVDTRLRPDGDSGPLIRSFAATMMYYESRGELWERQMLIKARRIAGDENFGARFLHALTPFIYPRSFFRSPVEEIAAIKARIENSSDEHNIKLCRGGIRDIEFIVQALQLLNAGQNSALQTGTTLTAIDLLRKHKILSRGEAETLQFAYKFYRVLEHRLQMMEYEQIHTLPESKNEQQALARRMNIQPEKFERLLAQHLSGVRKIFDSIFAPAPSAGMSDIEHIASEKQDAPGVKDFFNKFGIRNSAEAHRALKRLVYGSTLTGRKELTEQTRTLFKSRAEDFFTEISCTPSPDRALLNTEKIISGFPAKDSLYKLLTNENFRRAFVAVCGKSARIARALSNLPELTEMMMTGLAEIVSGTIQPLDTARNIISWKVRSEMQAAIRYELGEADEQTLFRTLTQIAEQAVHSVFDNAFSKIHFYKETQFVIIGLGKFGGEEINFDSDLDLLFLYRAEKNSEAVKCEKFASQLIADLCKSDSHGILYSIDARLRPEGKNAPLAVSLDAFAEYLHKRASLWERQSLTRARIIAGNETFGKLAMRTIRKFVYNSPLPSGWQKEILAMRTKTESRSRTFSAHSVDLKVGAGGLMDIEFCIQVLQLVAGKNADEATNMFDLLAKYSRVENPFGKSKFSEAVGQLNNNYHLLRKIETALRLSLDTQTNILPSDEEQLEYLGKVTGFASRTEFLKKIGHAMKENRRIFEHILSSIE